jgi:hypothetical protein
MQSAGSQQRMALAFAGLVVIGAMAMAMYELFSLCGETHHRLGAPRLASGVTGSLVSAAVSRAPASTPPA